MISCVREINDELYKWQNPQPAAILNREWLPRYPLQNSHASGADMVITNGDDVEISTELLRQRNSTLLAHKAKDFNIMDYIRTKQYN